MPDASPPDPAWVQWGSALGLFLGGLWLALKNMKPNAKPDDTPLSSSANAELVRLAKENAELRQRQATSELRTELLAEIEKTTAAHAIVVEANRQSAQQQINEMSKAIAILEGKIISWHPPHQP